jgi:hypothetical protein
LNPKTRQSCTKMNSYARRNRLQFNSTPHFKKRNGKRCALRRHHVWIRTDRHPGSNRPGNLDHKERLLGRTLQRTALGQQPPNSRASRADHSENFPPLMPSVCSRLGLSRRRSSRRPSGCSNCATLRRYHSRAARHRLPQKRIDSRLITRPLGLQPSENVGIYAKSHRLLDRPEKLPHHSPAPILYFRNVRSVDVPIAQSHQSTQLRILSLSAGPHTLPFQAWSLFLPIRS